MFHAPLVPHPDSPPDLARAFQLRAEITRQGRIWTLTYAITGPTQRLRLPPTTPHPAARDGLWRHTCLEAFICRGDGARYLECNFSPAGDWALYAFCAPRVPDPAAARDVLVQAPSCTRRADALVLSARIAPALEQRGARLRVGLCAVLESASGAIGWWALGHQAGKPDFHDPAQWVDMPAPAHPEQATP